MSWGLTQGILGRQRVAMAPSALALGPNTYLSQRDFLIMLAIAFVAHAMVFIVAMLVPHETVTNIPVRAISFKLGDSASIITTPTAAPALPPPLPAPPIMQPQMNEALRAPTTMTASAVLPAPPAIAPKPQQYVREVGAAPTATKAEAVSEQEQQAVQAIRARYEQQISGWIQKHKFYPAKAGGREGRVVVRMRIDRQGNVRYYAVEESAGMTELDNAALDMIRRANPVPAVPENYPSGALIEFLIPISFKVPQ